MKSRIPPGPYDYLFGMRTLSRMKEDVVGTFTELQRAYGDSVSFMTGPYRLFVFYHPDQVREVLVTHAKSLIRLPRMMKTLAQWNGNSVLIAEGEQWIRQRRLVQPAFQPRRLENYGETMVANARGLVESWREAIDRDGYVDVDIDKEMTELTLSASCLPIGLVGGHPCPMAKGSPSNLLRTPIVTPVSSLFSATAIFKPLSWFQCRRTQRLFECLFRETAPRTFLPCRYL